MVIYNKALFGCVFFFTSMSVLAEPQSLCIAPISPFLSEINLSEDLSNESFLKIITPEAIKWDFGLNPELKKSMDSEDLKSIVSIIFKLKKCDFVLAPNPNSSGEWTLWLSESTSPKISNQPKKTDKAYMILQWVFKELGYNARILSVNLNQSITVGSFQKILSIPNIQGAIFKKTAAKSWLPEEEKDVASLIEVVSFSGTTGDFRVIMKDSKDSNYMPQPGDKILLSN